MNLFINAAQAINEKGEIVVSTRQKDEETAEIVITDNGRGIPEKDLLRIFDPFFTTKEVGQGIGLGLNVAYNIVKKHRGTIDVESSEGKGTTFFIGLPFQQNHL